VSSADALSWRYLPQAFRLTFWPPFAGILSGGPCDPGNPPRAAAFRRRADSHHSLRHDRNLAGECEEMVGASSGSIRSKEPQPAGTGTGRAPRSHRTRMIDPAHGRPGDAPFASLHQGRPAPVMASAAALVDWPQRGRGSSRTPARTTLASVARCPDFAASTSLRTVANTSSNMAGVSRPVFKL
jgi:hypothetical protein